jgi:hypothetical protein
LVLFGHLCGTFWTPEETSGQGSDLVTEDRHQTGIMGKDGGQTVHCMNLKEQCMSLWCVLVEYFGEFFRIDQNDRCLL